MERHHLLRRQVRRHLRDVSIEEPWRELLADVDRAYRQADTDRGLLERSLELTSDELLARNAELSQALAGERARRTASARLHDALGKLATLLAEESDVDRCIGRICDQVCEVLGVDRTSVWRFDETAGTLYRDDMTIPIDAAASYVSALCANRTIACDSAQEHPSLRELDRYLESVAARIAAPCRIAGHVVGVVHLEQVAGPRTWSSDELQFAGSVADCVSLALESARRRREQELRGKLEADLRQRDRMDSIGMLAGGIAHDFNNLLVPILSNSELVLESLSSDHPDRELVQEIVQAGTAARDLVSQLLAFSRKQVLQLRVIDAAAESSRVARLLVRTLPETIKLELALGDVVLPIRADPGQFQQVILNLVVNAKDAMPGGGTIRISGRRIEVAGATYVSLVVTDSGIGMDEATRTKVFEPFFTTKGLGRGTGLGLSTAYGIVQQHGGTLSVTSTPGQGSRFEIRLPMVVAEPERRTLAERERTKRHEVILVVEDEPIVLGVVRRVLQAQGYSVFHAGDPEEAIELARRHPELSLVLTDVMMPTMNGAAMFEEIRQQHEHVRVLYMSGYDSDVLAPQGVLGDDVLLLRKPFSTADLTKAVRTALQLPVQR